MNGAEIAPLSVAYFNGSTGSDGAAVAPVLRIAVFPWHLISDGIHRCGIGMARHHGKVQPTRACPYPGSHLELFYMLSHMLTWDIHLYEYGNAPANQTKKGIGWELSLLRGGHFDTSLVDRYKSGEQQRDFLFSDAIYARGSYAALTSERAPATISWHAGRQLLDRLLIYDGYIYACFALLTAAIYLAARHISIGIGLWQAVCMMIPGQGWHSSMQRHIILAPFSILCVILFSVYANVIVIQTLLPTTRLLFNDVNELSALVNAKRMRIVTFSPQNQNWAVHTEFNGDMDAVMEMVGRSEAVLITAQDKLDAYLKCVCSPVKVELKGSFSDRPVTSAYIFNKEFNATMFAQLNKAMGKMQFMLSALSDRYRKSNLIYPAACKQVTCDPKNKVVLQLDNICGPLYLLIIGVILGTLCCFVELICKMRTRACKNDIRYFQNI